MDRAPLISVVVPVLNEAGNLPELHRRLKDVLTALDGPGEIVYVNDGSTDQSVALIEQWLREPGLGIVLVKLSRGFRTRARPAISG